MRILGALLVVTPLMFGGLRAALTGTDYRYLLVAMAATITAVLVLGVPGRAPAPSGFRTALAALTAAIAAVGAALGLGASSLAAVLFVALSFTLCLIVGLGLLIRARAG